MGRCLFAFAVVSLLYGQPMSPETILIGRTRYHMIETLRRIPNYTCLETIERSVRRSDSKRASIVDALRLEVGGGCAMGAERERVCAAIALVFGAATEIDESIGDEERGRVIAAPLVRVL